MDDFDLKLAQLVMNLKAGKVHRIYLSHAPKAERQARFLADHLKRNGFDPVVAADARPHKDMIHDEADKYVVSKVIGSCDFTLVVV